GSTLDCSLGARTPGSSGEAARPATNEPSGFARRNFYPNANTGSFVMDPIQRGLRSRLGFWNGGSLVKYSLKPKKQQIQTERHSHRSSRPGLQRAINGMQDVLNGGGVEVRRG